LTGVRLFADTVEDNAVECVIGGVG
jgi:hypothetical protein